jgi:hypothetical protein
VQKAFISSPNLVSSYGLAAMAGGVVWSVKALISTDGAPLWPAMATDHLFVLAQLLFLAGIVGLYARCKDSLEGVEGGVAFAVSSVGIIASCVGQVGLLLTEMAWYVFGFGCVVECVGLMALGATASQAKTLPYWNSLPFVIGLLGIFSFPLGNPPNSVVETYLTVTLQMLFGLGWIFVGYHLFFLGRGKEAQSGLQ